MNQFKIILFSSFFSLAIMLASGFNNCVLADTVDVGVYIDGAEVSFPDVKPYISDSRTFVPVRFISEQLGASVDWNSDTGTVVITKDAESIKLVIGSTEVVQNGVAGLMDVAPAIIDGRTMVPLRFVSELLGVEVDWDVSNNAVLINTPKTNAVYTIKTGDTLWKIALTYGVSLDELLEVNPELNPDKLMIDQQINLPLASAVETQAVETPAVSRGGGRTTSLSCTTDEFVEYAKELLGVPYAYGGTTLEGFDCSGFTQYVTAHFGGYLPHSSGQQYSYGIGIEKEDLLPGDLVFFGTSGDSTKINHVGIYIGNGKFIHSPQAGGTVEISNLSNVYFDQYYYGAIRMEMADVK